MFCKNCGKEIDDNATVCVHCGVATGKGQQQQQQVVTGGQTNGFAIAGFVLSFFGGLLGLILSIVGLQKSKLPEYNGNGRGLAIGGIVISCIVMSIFIIVIAACASCVACAADPNTYSAILLPLV